WGAYLRRLESTNVSSNSNENFDPLLPATIANAQGSMDRSLTESSTWGLSLQYTDTQPWAGMDNQWSLGATLDAGRTEFRQWSAPGNFTADRTVTVIGAETMDTFARTHNRYAGLYFTDTLSLNQHWHTTLSGRWNNAQVNIADASGSNPALNGDHHYSRVNPAIGLNFTPVASFTAYGSYNEGMRVATPMELSCADPAIPCKLPNNFLADPSLKPVISRTLETGMRGHLSEDLSYSAAIFRTTLDDDIQFISSGGNVNAGYFQNVGQTRRQGLELGVEQRLGKLNLSAGYSYLQATYESALTLHSPSNSSAGAGGDIQVQSSDKMPGIPQHNLRLRADYTVERGRIGASLVAVGSQYARGDENNRDSHGKLPGYSVVNLDGEYHLGRDWDLLGRVSNLFDRRYEGVAVLGDNLFTGPGRSFNPAGAVAEQFRSPASPRGIWIGLRYAWSGK
ncbi:MAG TPA: TonB-dependent receptor, partial [Rhodocyclaceae bacterium]